MISISEQRKQQLIDNFKNRKIIVIGDLMLDRYLWGTVAGISPEAPVPVVEIESEATNLGGAANVAHNLTSLGAIAIPVGVVGDDDRGELLLDLCKKMNFVTEGVIVDKSRNTTVKTRIIAHNQHVVRADRESKHAISSELAEKLIEKLNDLIDSCDAIIFQDYNKGLLTADLIKGVIQSATSKDKIITVDPKFDNFFEYQNVTVFKPNRKETERALGIKLAHDNELRRSCLHLKKKLSCESVLITLGEKGMCLLEPDFDFTTISTRALKVHDVSGAGDTVISTLTLAIVAGATLKEATTFANYAAGIVCNEVGVVPVQIEELTKAIK